jgi:hypothetical protein
MKRKLTAFLAVLSACLCTSTAHAQEEVGRTRITTETMTTPSSTLTTQTVDIDYEIDKRRDQGWNSQWGLLFSLNTPFANLNDILTSFDGLGAAGFYTLSPDMMLRGGFTLSRNHTPSQVTKTTLQQTGEDTATYTQTIPANTTTFTLNLHGDLLWRLTRNKVAPYAGFGALIDYTYNRASVDDEAANPTTVTEYRNRNTDLTFGGRGIVGAEWRIHSNFAIFAEYALGLTVVRYTIRDDRTTYRDANGSGQTSVHTESNVARWLNLSTSLRQGASLGVMVFF